MYVVKSEHVIVCDVDDTLIHWDQNHTQPFEGAVQVTCPHDGQISFHRPHKRHIGFIKKQKAKGYTIVVWSAAGTGWARAVVEALELQEYVDVVMSKPVKWIDDLIDPAQVLGSHIYLNEDEGHSI